MVAGALKASRAQVAVAVSGVAGPSGGMVRSTFSMERQELEKVVRRVVTEVVERLEAAPRPAVASRREEPEPLSPRSNCALAATRANADAFARKCFSCSPR